MRDSPGTRLWNNFWWLGYLGARNIRIFSASEVSSAMFLNGIIMDNLLAGTTVDNSNNHHSYATIHGVILQVVYLIWMGQRHPINQLVDD